MVDRNEQDCWFLLGHKTYPFWSVNLYGRCVLLDEAGQSAISLHINAHRHSADHTCGVQMRFECTPQHGENHTKLLPADLHRMILRLRLLAQSPVTCHLPVWRRYTPPLLARPSHGASRNWDRKIIDFFSRIHSRIS
jgi:hypothetical protein